MERAASAATAVWAERMDTLSIESVTARYRLPAAEAAQKERLDRVLVHAVGDVLEAALDRAGIPVREEICIRSVRASARLRLSASDSSLAVAWSLTLVDAIRDAIAASGGHVVQYASRNQALLDLVAGVSVGDLSRSWAWRQMGLWTAGGELGPQLAVEEAMRILASEPKATVAVLSEAARLDALSGLLRGARPEHWVRLARVALTAASAPFDLLDVNPGPQPASQATATQVRRILLDSSIARAAVQRANPSANPNARALAILAVLEFEPAGLRRGGSFARGLVAGVEAGLVQAAAALDRPALRTTLFHQTGALPLLEATGSLVSTTEASRGSRGVGRSAPLEHVPAQEERVPSPPFDGPPAAKSLAARRPLIDDRPLPDVRRRAATRAGGLLFLLHLLSELGLPEVVQSDDRLADRSLRWVLHALALAIGRIEPTDPAALAFAGLAPHVEPPSSGEETPSEVELEAVQGLRTRVVEALRLRLESRADTDELLLAWVCVRPAQIVADPGWIEVRLSFDDVSTEIRRAGLDLDPGWIPWLGVVMRFVYA